MAHRCIWFLMTSNFPTLISVIILWFIHLIRCHFLVSEMGIWFLRLNVASAIVSINSNVILKCANVKILQYCVVSSLGASVDLTDSVVPLRFCTTPIREVPSRKAAYFSFVFLTKLVRARVILSFSCEPPWNCPDRWQSRLCSNHDAEIVHLDDESLLLQLNFSYCSSHWLFIRHITTKQRCFIV